MLGGLGSFFGKKKSDSSATQEKKTEQVSPTGSPLGSLPGSPPESPPGSPPESPPGSPPGQEIGQTVPNTPPVEIQPTPTIQVKQKKMMEATKLDKDKDLIRKSDQYKKIEFSKNLNLNLAYQDMYVTSLHLQTLGHEEDKMVDTIVNKVDTRPFYKKYYIYTPIPMQLRYLIVVLALIIGFLIWAIVATVLKTKFENKNTNDPYGMGIRHYVSRDDTGAIPSSLEERQFGSKQLKIEPLTSSPEPPNFTKYYNIEANIKDGSVMIDRENFENIDISNDKLHNAIKGL